MVFGWTKGSNERRPRNDDLASLTQPEAALAGPERAGGVEATSAVLSREAISRLQCLSWRKVEELECERSN